MIVPPSPTLHRQPRAPWSAADPLTGTAREQDCNLIRGPGPSIIAGPARGVVSENSPAPGEGRYVLFLGRVDVYRAGLDLLLAAVDLVPPPLPVILAGTGRRAERRKLVRLLGRTSGPVAWVGDVAAPARGVLLRQCAFLVEPTRSGPTGRSVLEAMACGKPVVRFDLPGARWPGDEAAIRVPAADVTALAVAITTLSTDDALRARMGHAAARHVSMPP
jgi:glycosyltransferase involved in cell wall biosynthesis